MMPKLRTPEESERLAWLEKAFPIMLETIKKQGMTIRSLRAKKTVVRSGGGEQ